MATIPITKKGAEKLKQELHTLKTVDRPWVINAIAEARLTATEVAPLPIVGELTATTRIPGFPKIRFDLKLR